MNSVPPTDTASRVLVTGLGGFTGRYLRHALEAVGYEVHGLFAPGLDWTARSPGPNDHVADLLDLATVKAVVRRVKPSHVMHLAAISFVAHDDAAAIYATNIVGTRNLLDALSSTDAPHCVVLASSASIYGNAVAELITEEAPPRPANDYGVSKLAMEHLAWLWADRLPVTIVRPFNYTGIGQSDKFLVPKIVNAYKTQAPALELGNIAVERDFSDVRDVADAYVQLLQVPSASVVNICSGTTHTLQSVLEAAQSITGHRLEIQVNPVLVRPNEVRRLRGSNARLRALLPGWSPRPFRETLNWMLTA
jgi:nucleoside-diphosphate-sugar epimerase